MWYSVALIFERIHPDCHDDDELWEESFVLVDATDEADAAAKADQLGRKREISQMSISAERVEWRYVAKGQVYEILDKIPTDGAEIFSRFLAHDPRKRGG